MSITMLSTNYGLTQYAATYGTSGLVVPNLFIGCSSSYTTISALSGTYLTVPARVDQAGDTQLVLGPYLSTQEVVTFTSVTGTGPYVYTLSTTPSYVHNAGDMVIRVTNQNDTSASFLSEIQWDSVALPHLRLPMASGTSLGNGQFTLSYFITGGQGQVKWSHLGLFDNNTIGSGNMWASGISGFDHTIPSGSLVAGDVTVNVTIQLSNV